MATVLSQVSRPHPTVAAISDAKSAQATPTTIVVEEVSLTLATEVAQPLQLDQHMCDDECYDCLDCDYEHFDQYSDHFVSAPGTPALSASPSATPADPSTPVMTPETSPLAMTFGKGNSLSLGERLLSWGTHGLQVLGSSALHAILPGDDEIDHTLHLAPRKQTISDAIASAAPACGLAPTPAILLEPARPGAHVRFLVAPRHTKVLPTPSIAAFGSSIFGTSAGYDSESDEEYEMCDEDIECA